MVPALFGCGSPFCSGARRFPDWAERVDLGDLLKLAEIDLLLGGQPANHSIVRFARHDTTLCYARIFELPFSIIYRLLSS